MLRSHLNEGRCGGCGGGEGEGVAVPMKLCAVLEREAN